MSQLKALVVEDDTALQFMYKMKLENSDFAVATADNGNDGLHQAKSFEPDIILLDIKMPHMNGDEMLEKLRASDWGKNMRVIILTNISRDEAPAVLRFLNVDRYIVKAHHTPQQVIDIVREVLN